MVVGFDAVNETDGFSLLNHSHKKMKEKKTHELIIFILFFCFIAFLESKEKMENKLKW